MSRPEIHDVNDVGFSCNRTDNTYEDITVRRVHIENTGQNGGPGECMYLGCNNNACQMWDSLIEFNWCHDTLSGSQGDGIELKTGSYNTIIRHNVIHDVKYPAITMYGTVGNKAPNVVDGNVIWNVVDNGIQTVGDVEVRNNIVMNVGASGIAAKPSQGEIVENATIVHNTVMGAGDACLRGNDLNQGDNNVFANNALYCGGSTSIRFPAGQGSAVVEANAVVGPVNGANGGTFDGMNAGAAFADANGMDFYPVDSGPLVDAGDGGNSVGRDFNCLGREGAPDVGAYNWDGVDNPGWIVQEGFKECAEGGMATDSDGTDGTDSNGTDGTDGTDSNGTEGTDGSTGSSESDTSNPSTSSDTDDPSGSTAGPSGSGSDSDPSAGSDGSATTDGSGPDTAGGTDTADTDTEGGEGGCGCRSDIGEEGLPWLLLLAGGGLLGRRRRRR